MTNRTFEHDGITSRIPEGICRNCGRSAHEDHADLCCACFTIAFGHRDHDLEHVDAGYYGTLAFARREAFASMRRVEG